VPGILDVSQVDPSQGDPTNYLIISFKLWFQFGIIWLVNFGGSEVDL
jgi:hypothetical protein